MVNHCFYLYMDEVLDVLLQCLVGLQRDGQVAIVFLVAQVHLDACLPAGEGKNDDVIKGPGVVLVWGVESQLVRGLFPEVNQEGGVDHGDGEAAHPFPFSNLKVVWGPLVEALRRNSAPEVRV